MERLLIVVTVVLGLAIVVFDWSSTMEFLLPMTDNRLIALFGCWLIFALPILEALLLLRAKEESQSRTLARQWPLTLFFAILWVIALLAYGNQATTPFFSSSVSWIELLPAIRMTLQIVTASLAAGVAFVIASGTFLRLPAASIKDVAMRASLDELLAAAEQTERKAELYQGYIDRIELQLRGISQKTRSRLENLARIDADHELEKRMATNSVTRP